MNNIILFIKEHKIKLILVAVLVILLSVISVLGVVSYTEHRKIKAQDASLTQNAKDISELRDLLSKTEEGRKQLEGIKVNLEQDKAKLSDDNTALNQKAAAIQADLDKKQASLTQANADLAAKQASLSKAQRGIALFDSVKSQFDQYNVNLEKAGEFIFKAIDAENRGDSNAAMNYINQAEAYSRKADVNYGQIVSILNKIKSGNY